MLKNRQQNDVRSASDENQTSSISEMTNPNSTAASVSNSTFSTEPAEDAANSAMANGSLQTITVNGVNNNEDDHSEEEGEELSSSVVIEVVENPPSEDLLVLQHTVDMTMDDIETTLEDGAGSSSQDDGMISSAATSTNSSVVSVGRRVQQDQPAPVPVAAAGDQPEVTDFLDMDFDVEPTSTDEDEENETAGFLRKEKLFKRDHDFSSAVSSGINRNCQHRRDDFVNFDFGPSRENRADDGFDYGDDQYAGPSTSLSNGIQSTAPKSSRCAPPSISDTLVCVHGCRACNSGDSSRRAPRPATAAGPTPVLGDLPSSPDSSVSSTSIPRLVGRHHSHLYARLGQQPLSQLTRFRSSNASVNISGPDGLRLARAAYVGFPSGSRVAGTGFTSTKSNVESGSSYRIWTIDEAEAVQATQIGPSMCGATALINVFKALRVDWENEGSGAGSSDSSDMERAVPTRQRANGAPVAEYLLSRSVAGTDAEDLIEAATALSGSRVMGRFFPMNERTITSEWQEEQFGRWLLGWLRRGAIPVLTLNMQRGLLPTEPMPDAWHHQMVFGVCTKMGGVYSTNPLECVPLWFLKHALCSPSVLLVKAEDVRERWNGRVADLSPLLASLRPEQQSIDSRAVQPVSWTEMNVIGQVARALRQTGQSQNANRSEPRLTHIAIPARYRSGVSLFARAGSEVWTAISNAPGMDAALALPPSRLPTSTFCDEAEEDREEPEASSVVITVDAAANGRAEAGQSASDDGEFADISDEFSNHDHGEHSQSCTLM